MTTATITQAQSNGLRHQIAGAIDAIRKFSIELYTAHGGWFAQPGAAAQAKGERQSVLNMMILGTACENYAPALAAEMNRDTASASK